MLLPEQSRALAYARKRGTHSPVSEIRGRVTGTYAEIEALVEPLSPAQAGRQSAVSGWTVHEVVTHLILSDRPAIEQLTTLLNGRDVAEAIPANLQAAEPFAVAWPALLAEVREVHRRILDLLAGATDELPLVATAPVRMVVKCAGADGVVRPVEWEERFDWKAFSILLHAHSREHIAQIRRILGAHGD